MHQIHQVCNKIVYKFMIEWIACGRNQKEVTDNGPMNILNILQADDVGLNPSLPDHARNNGRFVRLHASHRDTRQRNRVLTW